MELMPWGHYERLRPAEIDSIRSQHPIAYIPWGALEWHSYHAPIGLDGMKAHGLCVAMARQTGGVVLPPVYVATDTIKPLKGFKHTLEHSEDTIKTLCREYLEQLADEGFKVLVVMTGHYGGTHRDAIVNTAEAFSAANPDLKVWAFPDSEPMEGHFKGDHAAIGETSFQLLFDGDLVDLSLVPQDRAPTLDDDGVWGDDPKNADAERGRRMLKTFLDHTVARINELASQTQ
jgi:creatinine amidohydrolase